MNRKDLKQKLDELNIYEGFYSLDGTLLPDRMVLYQSYNDWVVFYFDERGNRERTITFSSEQEACQYLYEYFKRQKENQK